MERKQKRFRSLLATFVLLAAVAIMAFSSTSIAAAQVTVKLDANGGKVSPSSVKVTVGGRYGVLPSPVREGYEFEGWYTAKSGGTKVTSSTKVTNAQNHTLYARWTAKKYKVTLDGAGAKGYPKSFTVRYGSTYGYISSPRKDGYVFVGWYTAPNGKGKLIGSWTTVKTAKNHTLYAKWTPIVIEHDMEEFRLK